MASGTQQPHQPDNQQQQRGLHQPQQTHDQLMRQDQPPQMQFASNQPAGIGQATYDHQQPQRQQQQQHQVHQHSTMSPIATTPIPLNSNQGHMVSLNPQQHQTQLMDSTVSSAVINQGPCNQTTSHVQLHQQQQQKSQILPLLLSPRPPNLKLSPGERAEQSEDDHDQIIDQVISLENEFNDSSTMLANADSGLSVMVDQQQSQQLQLMSDMNLTSNPCLSDSNQLSSSSEDLLNLLLELDREPSNLIGLGSGQQLDQDEKVGIENIRKQLMSCEVQSDQVQNQHNECMSPIMNQMTYQPQQSRTPLQQQQLRPMTQHHNSAQQQQVGQVISQTSPVISQHQQQPHHMSSPSQQPIQNDQSITTGSYSNLNSSTVPVSSSAQSYAPQQQHQSVSRISQTNPLNIVGNSPSPSWQPPLSPYSPPNPHNNSRATSQHHGMQHHHHHHHQQQQQQHSTTSTQIQQMHHPLQRRSPSHSVSPPATTEPSPVVKKNPLLNAQLVNSRAPSITPTRFINSQTSVLNQNPILNAKLSQSPYCSNTTSSGTSPVPNPQNRFIQSTQQSSNFNFDVTQHQHNAHPHTTPQPGHMTLYRPSDQQQEHHQQQQQQLPPAATSQAFRTTPSPAVCSSPITMLSTSPSGGLSQQVKDEIRRKVQQPKQHQTTSLLKQLLSDDNK